jgi:hypothetical protein
MNGTERGLSIGNRSGQCFYCKGPLGWYESKWIEQVEPLRIACYDCCGAKDCRHKDNPNAKNWRYYTDG